MHVLTARFHHLQWIDTVTTFFTLKVLVNGWILFNRSCTCTVSLDLLTIGRGAMKIVLLGATGPSGQQVVKEALERGHEITALVRNPDKLEDKHEKLKVHTVDIFDEGSLVSHLRGQDAVLSCLGAPPSYFSLWSITFYTDYIRPLVRAMREAGVTRLVFMTAWYTKYDPNHPFFVNWFLKPLFLGQTLKNMGEMEDYVDQECGDLEYTAVRPPQLKNTDSEGKPVCAHEGQVVPIKQRGMSRRDVAKFMLDITERGEYIRKFVAICTPLESGRD